MEPLNEFGPPSRGCRKRARDTVLSLVTPANGFAHLADFAPVLSHHYGSKIAPNRLHKILRGENGPLDFQIIYAAAAALGLELPLDKVPAGFDLDRERVYAETLVDLSERQETRYDIYGPLPSLAVTPPTVVHRLHAARFGPESAATKRYDWLAQEVWKRFRAFRPGRVPLICNHLTVEAWNGLLHGSNPPGLDGKHRFALLTEMLAWVREKRLEVRLHHNVRQRAFEFDLDTRFVVSKFGGRPVARRNEVLLTSLRFRRDPRTLWTMGRAEVGAALKTVAAYSGTEGQLLDVHDMGRAIGQIRG